MCRASETAINHGQTLKHYIKTEETVNKVNIHNSGEENKDCIFCTTKQPLKYKFCPLGANTAINVVRKTILKQDATL